MLDLLDIKEEEYYLNERNWWNILNNEEEDVPDTS